MQCFSRSVLALALAAMGHGALANVTELEITKVEPFAEGHAFGGAGAYERVTAIAHGELDPADPLNRGIVGLQHAPRNAHGKVDYQTEVFILRPAKATAGNGKILYEVNNRGDKFLLHWILDAPGKGGSFSNDPRALEDAGNGLFFRQGYTIVWSGWDADTPAGFMRMQAPPTLDENGKPVVRTIREELVSGTRFPVQPTLSLSFATTDTNPAHATLSVRERESDPSRTIPATGWEYVGNNKIRLLPEGTAFAPGALYELHYPATGSKVQGIGFAATRDVVSFLRYYNQPHQSEVLAVGISQSGRFLRDFIGQGFNQDEGHRIVFDGVLTHIAGVGRVFLNYDFAQPGRTSTQHEDHYVPENEFPFASVAEKDPVTEKTGRLLRGDGFDPLLIELNTSTEYWQKGASLLHTDALGQRDLKLPDTTRVYMIAGTQHAGRVGLSTKPGACVNPTNPHSSAALLRALVTDLDQWVSRGEQPPANHVPTLAAGTLVPSEQTGFPDIPGMTIARHNNPLVIGSNWLQRPEPLPRLPYRTLVSRVDADGNETGGIRMPDIAAPLATYTGWNEYNKPYPTGELCDRNGSFVPFATTRAQRLEKKDPRLSIEERYTGREDYLNKVRAAANTLVKERFLLAEDADAYVANAGKLYDTLISGKTVP